jgi:hypothetical protein
MKRIKPLLILAFALLALALSSLGQSTAFTYQGRLVTNGVPATGNYDFNFQTFNNPTGGAGQGSPFNTNNISVNNGLFTVTLDFGSGAFTGPQRWLQIQVRSNGVGSFQLLNPRSEITPAPYGIYANSAGTANTVAAGSVSAAGIASGQVVKSLNGLKDAVTLSSGANVTLATNGSNLTISSTGGGAVFALNGTNAYYTAGNVGIGTSNPGQQLDVRNTNASAVIRAKADGTIGAAVLALDRASAASGISSAQLNFQTAGVVDFALGTAQGSAGLSDFSIYDYGSSANVFTIEKASGNIGIGTTAPAVKLHVNGAAEGIRIQGTASGAANTAYMTFADSAGTSVGYVGDGSTADNTLFLDAYIGDVTLGTAAGRVLTATAAGNVGIGTTSPDAALQVINPTGFNLPGIHIEQPASFDFAQLRMNVAGFPYWSVAVGSGASPSLNFNTSAANRMSLGYDGTLQVQVLQINGADVAEPFEMATKDLAKGSIVIIDENNPGRLTLSDRPYDQRVAGILSGANGVRSGICLSQQGFNAGGDNVALSGRVYALADASTGSIKPGDLLTTSSIPGHCMKATDHTKAQGSIIGKAMSSLEKGKGMVLVLVSLQ